MKNVLTLSILVVLAGGCTRVAPQPGGTITIKGAPYALVRGGVEVGEPAPAFTALDGDFKPVSLARFRGRPVLISAVPSLDTPVCSLQTIRFNESLAALPGGVAVITISMDLPFAQKRFCSKEKIEGMQVLSDAARREFGTRYGILIAERGLLARSVFVVGRDGRLRYRQVVPELTEQPDYDAALAAVREAAGEPVVGGAVGAASE